jgi:hypothetical protein
MRILSPKERDALPYVLFVLVAFVVAVGFLVFAVMTGT